MTPSDSAELRARQPPAASSQPPPLAALANPASRPRLACEHRPLANAWNGQRPGVSRALALRCPAMPCDARRSQHSKQRPGSLSHRSCTGLPRRFLVRPRASVRCAPKTCLGIITYAAIIFSRWRLMGTILTSRIHGGNDRLLWLR